MSKISPLLAAMIVTLPPGFIETVNLYGQRYASSERKEREITESDTAALAKADEKRRKRARRNLKTGERNEQRIIETYS